MTEERGALRPNEAARWLSVSRDTIDRLIFRGELKSYKVGTGRYISMDELRRFVREREEDDDGLKILGRGPSPKESFEPAIGIQH